MDYNGGKDKPLPLRMGVENEWEQGKDKPLPLQLVIETQDIPCHPFGVFQHQQVAVLVVPE